MIIKTNNVPRPVVYGFELTEKEKQELDYIDWSEFSNDDSEYKTFFRYKGQVYDLGEFVRIEEFGKRTNPYTHTTDNKELLKWQGIQTDSYFSGIVVKYTDDNESVVVGTYYQKSEY